MSTNQDITNETKPAAKGAECRTESENYPTHGRAHDEDAIDMIHHHNERGGKQRGPAPKPEPDYEVEGMRPHN